MRDADASTEWFEVFDDRGHSCGLVPRQDVHRQGLWHRSSDVWVFSVDGRLLLQRRARGKDLFPGCWDYSVGEHLQPKESHLAGARRGLCEELGITDCRLVAAGGLRRVRTRDLERAIDDRELARSFTTVHDGDLHPDPTEVAELLWMAPAAVARWMAEEPSAFTPWFLQAAKVLALIPAPDADPA